MRALPLLHMIPTPVPANTFLPAAPPGRPWSHGTPRPVASGPRPDGTPPWFGQCTHGPQMDHRRASMDLGRQEIAGHCERFDHRRIVTQWAHFMAVSAPVAIWPKGRPGANQKPSSFSSCGSGVDRDNIFRDVGLSGSTGANTRNGRRLVNWRLDKPASPGGGLGGPSRPSRGSTPSAPSGTFAYRQVRPRSLTPAEEA